MKFKILLLTALVTLGPASINTITAQSVVRTDSLVMVKGKLKSTEEKLKEIPEPSTLTWQKSKSWGDKLMAQDRVFNALRYYAEAVNKNPQATMLFQRLADGNYMLRNYAAANKYYKMLVGLDTARHNNFDAQFQYALTDKYLGNYEKSKLEFEEFNRNAANVKEQDAMRAKATFESQGCDLGIKLRDDKTFKETRVTHLESNINHPRTDYAPVLINPTTMVYSSWATDSVILIGLRERYATYSRIYQSKKAGNVWGAATLVPGEVNTINFHVGNTTYTPDGKQMYYTQCLQDDDQHVRCDIYKSLLGDTGWVAGIKLDKDINNPSSTNTEPSLGKNANGDMVLYFVSDRNKGKGLDLFSAKLNADGSLDKAQALPAPVNTDGDDFTPYYDVPTGILYFSSNGHINIGGADVFKTKNTNGSWSDPENLGTPINSSVDDMYYNWNEKEGLGFVVSNRPGSFGLHAESYPGDDIYQVYIKRIYLAVKGTLLNADTATQLLTNQVVTLFDANTGAVIKTYNSTDGKYFFDLQPDKAYKISAIRDGFFAGVQTFNTNGKDNSDTLNYTVSLKRMEKNKAYSLNNIYYEYDKADLTEASKRVLDTLFDILKENPNIVIELSSHTDGKGADKYNMDLSQKRAESCVNYLITEKGVAKERIVAKGYGKTMPVAPNTNPNGTDNPDGRQKNRRTEFKIIDELKKP